MKTTISSSAKAAELCAIFSACVESAHLHPDAWRDGGQAHAVAILDAFSSTDWDALCAALDSRSSRWLQTCAAMLDQAADAKRATLLLTILSKSADPDVAYEARDGLRYMT